MSNDPNTSKAQVDFLCLEDNCQGVVKFNLVDVVAKNFQVICPDCHQSYEFDSELKGKLDKLRKLIMVVREAEPILGDCNVSVNVPEGYSISMFVEDPTTHPMLLTGVLKGLNTALSMRE